MPIAMLKLIRSILIKDDGPLHSILIKEYLNQFRLMSFLYRFAEKNSSLFLIRWLSCFYALAKNLGFRVLFEKRKEVLACNRYANHWKAWDEYCTVKNINTNDVDFVYFSGVGSLRIGNLFVSLKLIGLILKRYTDLQKIYKDLISRASLFASVRVLTGVVAYCKLSCMNIKQFPCRLVISSDSDPMIMALVTFYLNNNLKVTFNDHGLLPHEIVSFDYDEVLLCGNYNLECLINSGCNIGTVVKKSHDIKWKKNSAQKKKKEMRCTLVALSKISNWTVVNKIVNELKGNPYIGQVLVKPHPAMIGSKKKLKKILKDFKIESIDPASTIRFDSIDLVFAGNSGVHIEALLNEVNSVYIPGMDNIPFDLYCFEENNMVYIADSSTENVVAGAESFYKNYNYKDRVSKYLY